MTETLHFPPIAPEQVSNWISFVRARPDWKYPSEPDAIAKPIEDLQAEGVAGIWNRLGRHKVAWLADEVGMGKTFQAMGVFALLWQLKSDARILVIAPNQSVAENWSSEFKSFLRDHYKHLDGVVKQGDHEACHPPEVCANLGSVVDAFAGNRRFVISKITIFSQLSDASDKNTGKEKAALARKQADAERQRLLAAIDHRIDLLVVDEAHYLRNVGGGSQRVDAARGFFGLEDSPLADRVLLMSATPNHTTNQDVTNVLGYFLASPPTSAVAALTKYGLRRLRRLSGRNKYHYRHEKVLECDFKDDIPAEVFFALYQKALADLEDEGDGMPLYRDEKRSFMYGYLEGFETTKPVGTKEDIQERSDYSSAIDSQVLMKLARKFGTRFSFPCHPKYDQTIAHLTPGAGNYWWREPVSQSVEEDKALVFVRRIPSSKELASRVNEQFDAMFIDKIGCALGLDGLKFDEGSSGTSSQRDWLHQTVTRQLAASVQAEDDSDEPEAQHVEFLPSRVMDYFIRKQEGREVRDTHGSTFRNRFNRTTDLFCLFFAPPLASHHELAYPHPGIMTDYRSWARAERLARYDDESKDNGPELEVLQRTFGARHLREAARPSNLEGQRIDTLAAIFDRHLTDEDREVWRRLLTGSPCAREAFFQTYLRKGLTLASGAIVELYCWFIKAHRSRADSAQIYQEFCMQVDTEFTGSLTQALMQQALRTYKDVWEKVVRLYAPKDVLTYAWNELNAQNPSAYCTSLVKDRARLITAFNTPFFPNVLIATSVLQEGVNLHLNCRRVLHYGISWTPGDNEQRVGRVDRLYGTVHRNIDDCGDAELLPERAQLEIVYPYLKGSFDEDQVGQFIRRKFAAETVLDRGQLVPGSKAIDFSDVSDSWRECLRRPANGSAVAPDPYPFREVVKLSQRWGRKPHEGEIDQGIIDATNSLLVSAAREVSGVEEVIVHRLRGSNVAWVIEPKLKNQRRPHQPVEIRIEHFLELSAQSPDRIACLTLTSPVSTKRLRLKRDLLAVLEREFPLVQICENANVDDDAFPVACRSTLPLLIHEGTIDNCSLSEVVLCLDQLIHGAEYLERLLAGNQDLSFKDIQAIRPELIPAGATRIPVRSAERRQYTNDEGESTEWKIHGNVARLELAVLNAPTPSVFAMQQTYPFLFGAFRPDRAVRWELRFPSMDFQVPERRLLEAWGRYLRTRIQVLTEDEVLFDQEL
ncbi:DEAD/DEAH box helicase family protein [Aromatoleum evansii]|uniref:DEAD/DEAH box helicase family protein n=1 Tax=Aromatoleum evansii TaxID=59406 RepID=UPI00145CD01D|nr:DEAD/DEAH box helicase family protein [Aromatoleum evansii]NMG31751.1 hypothetical protein [Aromatoleum evansii]